MIRTPGPSQVSRALASSAVVAVVEGVAVGVRSRSLTTITLRPRGTSIRVAPGSGENGAPRRPTTVGLGAYPDERVGGRSHGPSIVEVRHR